jgi:metal-responsive CopG/Arc/MetJ family transcriptional regulator
MPARIILKLSFTLFMAVNITLTLPEKVISRIDKDRGDINRSKFVLRLLEKAYTEKKIEQEIISAR